MNRKRRGARPADPMEIASRRAEERARQQALARDPATWGLDAGALALAANGDVVAPTDAAGRIVRARRQDVFELMSMRGRISPAALTAIRRLQEDVACLHRTALGGVDYTPRVDRSRDPQGFSDARRRAGERLHAALALAGAASARLLVALCEPDVVLGRAADWRAVVARETGETLADAQGAILRMACENLAGAYRALDQGRRGDRRLAESPEPFCPA
jgi:hypothetical protein